MKLQNKILILFLSLVFIGGCQNKKAALVKPQKQKKQDKLFLQESVARISQLPDCPFGFEVKKIVTDENNSENLQIFYQSTNKDLIDYRMIKDSYSSDMELLGWNLSYEFGGPDLILMFVKPSGKACMISLRSGGKLVVSILSKKRDL
ncbi:MAG: hypothetical protein NTU89_03865 [Candidatus Dependentiae bacterium]|nr:hypothetical protein [Candidatus Dependentiae bacterium]